MRCPCMSERMKRQKQVHVVHNGLHTLRICFYKAYYDKEETLLRYVDKPFYSLFLRRPANGGRGVLPQGPVNQVRPHQCQYEHGPSLQDPGTVDGGTGTLYHRCSTTAKEPPSPLLHRLCEREDWHTTGYTGTMLFVYHFMFASLFGCFGSMFLDLQLLINLFYIGQQVLYGSTV